MAKVVVEHSGPLSGCVAVGGSKNAALPVLCACLLTEETCTIRQVPPFTDVLVLLKILRSLGAEVLYDAKKQMAVITAKKLTSTREDAALAEKLRASFFVLAPLLARKHRAQVPLPGGCPIGTRPVDLHLKGLQQMGAKVKLEHGDVLARCRRFQGSRIYLDVPSVGATEQLLMAAVTAEGRTEIENAATEPEIVDLAAFLRKMGAQIQGAGTTHLVVTGVRQLGGARHTVISDRVEAGTFLAAVAAVGGDVTVQNAPSEHLGAILAKLKEAGVQLTVESGRIHIVSDGNLSSFDIKTMPYPGFPTDLQAIFMVLATVAKGTSVVTETLFENRFLQASQLLRMGADIKTEGRMAVVEGVKSLTGTSVCAPDLRAGAALVIAGLLAQGQTEIEDVYHIDRGYCHLEEKLQSIGACLHREEETEEQ